MFEDETTKALLIGGPGHGWTPWVYRRPKSCESILVTMQPKRAQWLMSVDDGSPAWEETWYLYRQVPDLPPDARQLFGYYYTGRNTASTDDSAAELQAVVLEAVQAARALEADGEAEHWAYLKRALKEAGYPPIGEVRDDWSRFHYRK